MTTSPKMDDDGLSREQIELWRRICLSHWIADESGIYRSHDESARQANALCDLALSAMESRSEVLEDETAWLIERGQTFNQSPPIWWKFDEGKSSRPNAGYASYEERWTEDANCARRFSTKEAAEAYAAVEISYLYLVTEHRWLAASVKSPRAEPGAQNNAAEQEMLGESPIAAPKAATPQVDLRRSVVRDVPASVAPTIANDPSDHSNFGSHYDDAEHEPAAPQEQEPRRTGKAAASDETSVTAAAYSPEFVRGMEETAKVLDAASGRHFAAIGTSDNEDDKRRHGIKAAFAMEIAAAIRAKIKPASGS